MQEPELTSTRKVHRYIPTRKDANAPGAYDSRRRFKQTRNKTSLSNKLTEFLLVPTNKLFFKTILGSSNPDLLYQ